VELRESKEAQHHGIDGYLLPFLKLFQDVVEGFGAVRCDRRQTVWLKFPGSDLVYHRMNLGVEPFGEWLAPLGQHGDESEQLRTDNIAQLMATKVVATIIVLYLYYHMYI